MPVASGEKRHRLTLHAPAGTRGDGTAVDLATGIPAKITAVPLAFQQQERLAAGGLNTQTLYAIVVSYRSDIATDLELHEQCCTRRVFQMVHIIPDDQRIDLDITAMTGNR